MPMDINLSILSKTVFHVNHDKLVQKGFTSKNGRVNFSATRSRAPLVGIDRAKPYKNRKKNVLKGGSFFLNFTFFS